VDPVHPIMVAEQWCRVTMTGPDGTALADGVLEGNHTPDLGAVDDLARLALEAKRLGGSIRLAEVSPALRSLLDLAGIVVEVDGLVVEVERQPEGGEQALGVQQGEKEHHAGDLAVGDLEDL
jgi:hypothetical protein